MSVCAVMLVKDEADIIGYTLDHLARQVDAIIVADNGSTDGTYEQLLVHSAVTVVCRDDEVGYYQDRKTTALAHAARKMGHAWVIPCDADEWWYAPDGRPLRDYLAGVTPNVRAVTAAIFNHFPSALDNDEESNPYRRIGWRQRSHGTLPKVCARTGGDLAIHMGNHGVSYDGGGLTVGGLELRHLSWRSVEQYVRKIRNGAAAYAATDLDETYGAHWRVDDAKTDEGIASDFETWFYRERPDLDDSMIFDPVPGA